MHSSFNYKQTIKKRTIKLKRVENPLENDSIFNKSMEKGLESHPVQKLYTKDATELNNYRKMSKLRAYWDSLSLFGKIVMAIALLIFVIVAGAGVLPGSQGRGRRYIQEGYHKQG